MASGGGVVVAEDDQAVCAIKQCNAHEASKSKTIKLVSVFPTLALRKGEGKGRGLQTRDRTFSSRT